MGYAPKVTEPAWSREIENSFRPYLSDAALSHFFERWHAGKLNLFCVEGAGHLLTWIDILPDNSRVMVIGPCGGDVRKVIAAVFDYLYALGLQNGCKSVVVDCEPEKLAGVLCRRYGFKQFSVRVELPLVPKLRRVV